MKFCCCLPRPAPTTIQRQRNPSSSIPTPKTEHHHSNKHPVIAIPSIVVETNGPGQENSNNLDQDEREGSIGGDSTSSSTSGDSSSAGTRSSSVFGAAKMTSSSNAVANWCVGVIEATSSIPVDLIYAGETNADPQVVKMVRTELQAEMRGSGGGLAASNLMTRAIVISATSYNQTRSRSHSLHSMISRNSSVCSGHSDSHAACPVSVAVSQALHRFYLEDRRVLAGVSNSLQQDFLFGADFSDRRIAREHLKLVMERLPNESRRELLFVVEHLKRLVAKVSPANSLKTAQLLAEQWAACIFTNTISSQKAVRVVQLLITDEGQNSPPPPPSLLVGQSKVASIIKRSTVHTQSQLAVEKKQEKTRAFSVLVKNKGQYRSLDASAVKKRNQNRRQKTQQKSSEPQQQQLDRRCSRHGSIEGVENSDEKQQTQKQRESFRRKVQINPIRQVPLPLPPPGKPPPVPPRRSILIVTPPPRPPPPPLPARKSTCLPRMPKQELD